MRHVRFPRGDVDRGVKGFWMSRGADRPDPGDAQAAAAYIAELSGSLAALARSYGFDVLSFVLEMAREEAETLSGGNGSRRGQ